MIRRKLRTSRFAVTALIFAAGPVGAGIEEFCAAEWPSDYVMQAYCVERQTEAAKKVLEWSRENIPGFDEANGGPCRTPECFEAKKAGRSFDLSTLTEDLLKRGHRATQISVRCVDEWSPDYVMVWHCIEQQEEGLRKLGQSLGDTEGETEFQREMRESDGKPGTAERAVSDWRAEHLPLLDQALKAKDVMTMIDQMHEASKGPEGRSLAHQIWTSCMLEHRGTNMSQDYDKQIVCLNEKTSNTAAAGMELTDAAE